MAAPTESMLWGRLLRDSGDASFDGYIAAPRPRPTRLAALDSLLGGGVYPGVNVLMAAPGAGKTALAIQLLAANAMNGGRSLMFSLEMPPEQVKMRVASMLSVTTRGLSPVPWNGTYGLADRSWALVDWGRAESAEPGFVGYLRDRYGNLGALPLEEAVARVRGDTTALVAIEGVMRACGDRTIAAIDLAEARVFRDGMAVTSAYRDAASICAATARVAEELGQPPLVCVDYLQLVDPPEQARGLGETEATKATSDLLAECARDTDAMVLCVSAKRKGGGADMEAARGSSAIAYNAQAVIHLDDDPEREAVRGWRPVVLDVSKNRSGSQGRVPLWFSGRHNAFSDAEEPPGEPGA